MCRVTLDVVRGMSVMQSVRVGHIAKPTRARDKYGSENTVYVLIH